jgi:hypothetical protein
VFIEFAQLSEQLVLGHVNAQREIGNALTERVELLSKNGGLPHFRMSRLLLAAAIVYLLDSRSTLWPSPENRCFDCTTRSASASFSWC